MNRFRRGRTECRRYISYDDGASWLPYADPNPMPRFSWLPWRKRR